MEFWGTTFDPFQGLPGSISAGRSHALHCVAEGSRPAADITWWKDGKVSDTSCPSSQTSLKHHLVEGWKGRWHTFLSNVTWNITHTSPGGKMERLMTPNTYQMSPDGKMERLVTHLPVKHNSNITWWKYGKVSDTYVKCHLTPANMTWWKDGKVSEPPSTGHMIMSPIYTFFTLLHLSLLPTPSLSPVTLWYNLTCNTILHLLHEN